MKTELAALIAFVVVLLVVVAVLVRRDVRARREAIDSLKQTIRMMQE